jgi:23S rRNA (adenine2503-C2)-methyltransferase
MSNASHSLKFAAPKALSDGRIPLIGCTREEITAFMEPYDVKPFRAKQIYHWIYQRGVQNFDDMANVPKDLREKLSGAFSLDRPKIARHQKSADGTEKWLLEMSDKQLVEAVFIPEAERGTLCVSSQVGCTLTCKFCHTGTQPLVRNLGPAEMLHQIMYTRDSLGEWPSNAPPQGRDFTNIVLMGMGEPLYNYENVAKAMTICMDPDGLAVSKRRITLSTSGVVPMIERCGQELGIRLAISLHAPNDELRSSIMPINNKYPLEQLMEACRTYPGVTSSHRITFEYVMLKGVNDSPAEARALVKLLDGIHAKVNLIPFNPWPGSEYECSSGSTIEDFAYIILKAGIPAPIRRTRGQDILAACGQLRSDSVRVRAGASSNPQDAALQHE